MRKIMKISIAACCVGVLLGGIGTGISIAEYTSLTYSGRHIMGMENMKEETIDTVVTPVEGKKLLVCEYNRASDVVYDESVPINTVRYKVKYNPDMVRIRTRYEEELNEDSEEESVYQGALQLYSMYYGNDFDIFMKNKDRILSELKQGKIGSYEISSIDNVEIWMNPQMKNWVDINW